MAKTEARSQISGEEIYKIAIGQGIYTAELASNIPDGFSAQAVNLVATGDSLENRIGIRPSSVDYHKSFTTVPHDHSHKIVHLDAVGVDQPCMAWGAAPGGVNTLSLIRRSGAGGDGYMEVSVPNMVTGIAGYSQNTYFTMDGGSTGVYKITSYNWVADSIVYASIPSGAGFLLAGLFSFKDRLWGWVGDKLYFTEIAPSGGLPETWVATNFVPFRSTFGFAQILQVVPLKNTLLVFTQAGIYTLTVQGSPSSWILRVLDSDSITTHANCAFESKGIIYYANSSGVWATNGMSVTKLSGVIEDQFFLSKGIRYHSLLPYEDGMILSVMKVRETSPNQVESDSCKVFYSKLEPIAWTEWGIHPPEGESNLWGTNRLCGILSISKKVPTLLNTNPTVYMLCIISDSTDASPQNTRLNLLVFDGGENKGRDRVGNLITDPLRISLKTKYMDGNNPYADKFAKEGMLELFTSDSLHMFSCSWDIDATSGANSRVSGKALFTDFASGRSSNLIRIPATFWWRRCAFQFASSLQSNESQLKIKDLAMRMDTGRPEFEQVR